MTLEETIRKDIAECEAIANDNTMPLIKRATADIAATALILALDEWIRSCVEEKKVAIIKTQIIISTR